MASLLAAGCKHAQDDVGAAAPALPKCQLGKTVEALVTCGPGPRLIVEFHQIKCIGFSWLSIAQKHPKSKMHWVWWAEHMTPSHLQSPTSCKLGCVSNCKCGTTHFTHCGHNAWDIAHCSSHNAKSFHFKWKFGNLLCKLRPKTACFQAARPKPSSAA